MVWRGSFLFAWESGVHCGVVRGAFYSNWHSRNGDHERKWFPCKDLSFLPGVLTGFCYMDFRGSHTFTPAAVAISRMFLDPSPPGKPTSPMFPPPDIRYWSIA